MAPRRSALALVAAVAVASVVAVDGWLWRGHAHQAAGRVQLRAVGAPQGSPATAAETTTTTTTSRAGTAGELTAPPAAPAPVAASAVDPVPDLDWGTGVDGRDTATRPIDAVPPLPPDETVQEPAAVEVPVVFEEPVPSDDGTPLLQAVEPPEPVSPTDPPTVESHSSTVAQAVVPEVAIFQAPDGPAPLGALGHPQPSGAPLVFLVLQQQPGWLEVLLPVRPNGSTGWIRRSDVELSRHDYRILVELVAHRITVFKADEVFHQEPIGVGTGATPTPVGLYYTKELLQPVDAAGRHRANGPYGPFAYGLSGFSEVLTSFAGGEGVVAIHGTNQPSSLGRDASHGCIRMSNEGISRLAEVLPLGVPVEIRP